MNTQSIPLRTATFVTALAFVLSGPASAQDPPRDLTELSIEELMNITVTLASKRAQRVADAAAAVYVITQEDIRRSGVSHIAEALRMVPGMQVGRIDGSKWAITSRGFNGRFANKLLVLIDGRSVYTPVFSGVHWDVQDLALEDIHQIEVIRGPGAALWGANAVNGIINVITKRAAELKGGTVSIAGGTSGVGIGTLRYGGTISENIAYRAYIKASTQGDYESDLVPANDRWKSFRAGVRTDWEASSQDMVTVQSDVYTGDRHYTVTTPTAVAPFTRTFVDLITVGGGNLLGRWERSLSPESDLRTQVYLDISERKDILHHERRTTVDVDVQYGFRLGETHDVVVGGAQRISSDRIATSTTVAFIPVDRTDLLTSLFVQDQIDLYGKSLFLTLGSKLERNSYTGIELQPNVRVLWNATHALTFWTSVSRAARTPSRAEHDIDFLLASLGGTPFRVLGSHDFVSEQLTAYEAGVRVTPLPSLSVELAAYRNDYRNLRTVELTNVLGVLLFDNKLSGTTAGFEANATLRVGDAWRLAGGYSLFTSTFALDPSSIDFSGGLQTGADSPRHQVHLRSFVNLTPELDTDILLYHVARVPNQDVAAYTRVDARISYRLSDRYRISGGVQNLLSGHHREFSASPLNEWNTRVPRTLLARVTWEF